MGDVQKKEAICIYQTEHGEVKLSPAIVRRYLVSGEASLVTDAEVIMFMQLCRFQGLNPFLREAYLIKYSGSEPATLVTGKDTFTKRATRIRECQGWNAGVIVRLGDKTTEREGAMVDDGEHLIGGWAKVFRSGWAEPLKITVSLAEYEKHKKDGSPTRTWKEMPATMIRKVALVQGLREAFPEHYQGMYDAAEVASVDTGKLSDMPIDVTPEPAMPAADEAGAAAAFDAAETTS